MKKINKIDMYVPMWEKEERRDTGEEGMHGVATGKNKLKLILNMSHLKLFIFRGMVHMHRFKVLLHIHF